jgi:hypothetical protein
MYGTVDRFSGLATLGRFLFGGGLAAFQDSESAEATPTSYYSVKNTFVDVEEEAQYAPKVKRASSAPASTCADVICRQTTPPGEGDVEILTQDFNAKIKLESLVQDQPFPSSPGKPEAEPEAEPLYAESAKIMLQTPLNPCARAWPGAQMPTTGLAYGCFVAPVGFVAPVAPAHGAAKPVTVAFSEKGKGRKKKNGPGSSVAQPVPKGRCADRKTVGAQQLAMGAGLRRTRPVELTNQFITVVLAGQKALTFATQVQRAEAQEIEMGWSLVAEMLPQHLKHCRQVLTNAKKAMMQTAKRQPDVLLVSPKGASIENTSNGLGLSLWLICATDEETLCKEFLVDGTCPHGLHCSFEHPAWRACVDITVKLC